MKDKISTDHYYALIMAGGGGTRLWPMSRQDKPKQMLSLIDDRTLFRTSVDRLMPLFPAERIYIVTGTAYVESLMADAPEIPRQNFVVEPYGKNTCPAAALGIATIHKRDPLATVALLTADHHIGKEQDFRDLLQAAHNAAQGGSIVTLGITPTFPATGFGYICQGEQIATIDKFICYQSLGFTEKPDMAKAITLIRSGQYSWNSGMFIWTADHAMAEFSVQQPRIYKLLQKLLPAIDTNEYPETLLTVWEEMPQISIDFAIMENATDIVVIPAEIGWSDVGSWTSLFDVHQLDKSGSYFKGNEREHIVLDSENLLVYSERLVATIGIKDIIIVDTPDALLVCHKDRAQDVKDIVNQLRLTQRNDYL